MNNTSFGTQTSVYFKKVFRISMRERAWKYLVFAAIIGLIVVLVVGENMFKSYDSTSSGFFTLVSACIWIGIFNSIQSVCKEHEIIRAEYRQGMKLGAYIMAHVLWQALLCLAESIVVFVLCCINMHFDKSPHLLVSAYLENFVTIYLLVFGAAVLGLMISSVSATPTTAMTIMPFVLIVQLILSGVLFKLDGATGFFANLTLSKWGMSAFGCEADLNNMNLAINGQLMQEGFIYPQQYLMSGQMLKHTPAVGYYDPKVITLLLAWLISFVLTAFNAVIAVVALKLKNRDS